MIDVVWLPPSGLDQTMLHDLFDGEMWPHNLQVNNIHTLKEIQGKGAVVVVPGAYHDIDKINEQIFLLEWVVVIVVSDENNLFPVEELAHPNMKIWVQTPRVGRQYGDVRYFGVGYGDARKYRGSGEKCTDVFLSGQNTHARRNEIFDLLSQYKESHPELNVHLNPTKGFTQGYTSQEYYRLLEGAKIAPAPSGIVSPDSFRVYEALELGCIPIADDLSPTYDSRYYWKMLFPDTPMPILSDANISDIIDREIVSYPQRRNEIFAWWIGKKREYVLNMMADLESLGVSVPDLDDITIVIPVSPWKSHPDTYILEETINSAQAQLPGREIIVTFDGVRHEQMDRFEDYQEFVGRMLWKINTEYKGVLPLVFNEHSHQAKMMREALRHVTSRYILYLEGDSPLYIDRNIDWDGIVCTLKEGADVVRLYNKEEIPKEHEYLMYPKHSKGNYTATRQWSQQPHIASVDAYKRIMKYFSDKALCYIEDKIYYVIAGEGWKKWKMYIYKPDNMPRSYHLDGRSGEEKYDDRQIY